MQMVTHAWKSSDSPRAFVRALEEMGYVLATGICALSALCVAVGDFVAVGDDDGWIILPPQRFVQPAQWALLKLNAGEEAGEHCTLQEKL